MNIYGAIDNISFQDGSFKIGGWVFCKVGDKKIPVNKIFYTGIQYKKLYTTKRIDIDSNIEFGFQIEFDDSYALMEIFHQRSFVVAKFNEIEKNLGIWKELNGKIISFLIKNQIKNLDEKFLPEISGDILKKIKSSLVEDKKNCNLISEDCIVTVGMRSLCNTAIVGNSGFFFIYDGSNGLNKLYNDNLNLDLKNKWIGVIKNRKILSQSLGFNFFQMILPEKQSVLRNFYPGHIKSSTIILSEISKDLDDCEFYLNLFNLLESGYVDKGVVPYRKVDTHLNYFGYRDIFLWIVENVFKVKIDIGNPVLEERVLSGDLGDKFGTLPFVEKALMPIMNDWSFSKINPDCIYNNSSFSKHVGTKIHWRNNSPMIDKKIMIFGNSVFERGGSPLGLSWWFSRVFKETVFIWSGNLDVVLVNEHKPDYVFCQTVERFLSVAPNS